MSVKPQWHDGSRLQQATAKAASIGRYHYPSTLRKRFVCARDTEETGALDQLSIMTSDGMHAGVSFMLLLFSVAAVPVQAGPVAPGRIGFDPHLAVYDISLARADPGSTIADLEGRMVYELTGNNCDGYTQNLRFVTRTANQDGALRLNDLRTSSWEDPGATRLRFSSQTYQDETLSETTRGHAKRHHNGSAVTVFLTKPTRKSVKIAFDVLFPVQHSKSLIEAARKNESAVTANFYDGSERGERYYATHAVVGDVTPRGTIDPPSRLENGPPPDDVTSWPIAMSFFKPGSGKQDATPEFEMSYRFHENGVTSTFLMEHGNFAIRGKLVRLTYLDRVACTPAE